MGKLQRPAAIPQSSSLRSADSFSAGGEKPFAGFRTDTAPSPTEGKGDREERAVDEVVEITDLI